VTGKRRVTVVLDDEIDKKLRNIQVKLIRENNGGYSFSKVVDIELRKSLGKFKK